MAEGRMIRKKASTDDRLAQLSSNACLLYLHALPHLDVEGRMDGLPVAVRGTVVPYRARRHAAEWTDELVEQYICEWTLTVDEDGHVRPLVLWYAVKGMWVCAFLGFEKNQTIRRDREAPSRFPAPPEDLLSSIPSCAVTTVRDADPAKPVDGVHGPVGERLFADDAVPRAVADEAAVPPNDRFEQNPGALPAKAEAEVEVQAPAEQRRAFARAREGDGPAALPDSDFSEDPLAADILAGVQRRREGLATHGELAVLLEVLSDADDETPTVMHALFDPLGVAAIRHARREIEQYQPRSPSRYAVGIAKKLARKAAAA